MRGRGKVRDRLQESMVETAWRLGRIALLLPLGLVALGLAAWQPARASEAGGVHIIGGPSVSKISGSSVTVTWTTDEAKVGKVKWGPGKGDYHHALKESAPTAEHSIALTGLKRNKKYHFKVFAGQASSKDATFTMADYSDDPFTFANMGDNRGHSSASDADHVTPSFQNVVNAAAAKSPAFTVHVGDLFFGKSDLATTRRMYSTFKAAIQPLVSVSASAPYPFTISPGNHEMRPECARLAALPAEACTPAFDPFALFDEEFPDQPQNGPPDYLGTTFSFDYGNSHFASIDACHFDAAATTGDFDLYHLSDEVLDWLDADLAAAQRAHYRHIFVFGHPEAWAPDGIRWSTVPTVATSDLYGTVGRVAVGSGGTILASNDGRVWKSETSGTTATLRSVAVGPVYAAVGDGGTILTRGTSGGPWEARASGTTRDLNCIFWNGSLFVTAGSGGTILASEKGSTWKEELSGTTQDLYGVTEGSISGHKEFVAVGKGGTLLTSPDAHTWTARASGTTEDLRGVTAGTAYGMPFFAAVGNAGTILTSPDGVTWTRRDSGVSADLNAVLCPFIYIAVGDDGVALTSEDGVEWVRQASGTTVNLRGLDHWDPDELAEMEYFAVGDGGAILVCPEWLEVNSLGSYKSQRDRFWQILAAHGVDAYLCGHVHIFDDSFTVDGVVQWLDGNSGSTGVGNGRWTLWSIDGETATADLMDESGSVVYTRVIRGNQP